MEAKTPNTAYYMHVGVFHYSCVNGIINIYFSYGCIRYARVYNLQPLSCMCCLFSRFCLGCFSLGSSQLLFHYFTKYASDAIPTASFLSRGVRAVVWPFMVNSGTMHPLSFAGFSLTHSMPCHVLMRLWALLMAALWTWLVHKMTHTVPNLW